MLAFLDTEFTDLVYRPRLLSVGMVVERGINRAFYAEVTDKDRLQATNGFGQRAVLPQFGKIADAACAYAELGGRLCAFLGDLAADLEADEFVDLAFGYDLDWELIDLAVRDSGAKHWAALRRRIRPINVYAFTGFDAGKRASEAYFQAQMQAQVQAALHGHSQGHSLAHTQAQSQALAPIGRHHALCDAQALRVAYDAATEAALLGLLQIDSTETDFAVAAPPPASAPARQRPQQELFQSVDGVLQPG